MNGIEKITSRIEDEARQDAAALLSEARSEAQAISQRYRTQAEGERRAILEQGRKDAQAYVDRVESAARLEGRNRAIADRQGLIDAAFDAAMERLCSLPREEYIKLLASLCARNSTTGRERVILSPTDREQVGAEVVRQANAILSKKVSPTLPQELTDTKAGALLDKVVSGAAAVLAGTGMLSLADETVSARGGVILSDNDVDVNCTFETILRLQREEMAGQVSQLLFTQ